MAALSIRNIDDTVVKRLRVRAARRGTSMEAEARSILAEAVAEAEGPGLLTTIMDRFGAAGGVELDVPARNNPVRVPPLPE